MRACMLLRVRVCAYVSLGMQMRMHMRMRMCACVRLRLRARACLHVCTSVVSVSVGWMCVCEPGRAGEIPDRSPLAICEQILLNGLDAYLEDLKENSRLQPVLVGSCALPMLTIRFHRVCETQYSPNILSWICIYFLI